MLDFFLTRWSFPSLYCWIVFFPTGLVAGTLLGWLSGYWKKRYDLPVGYSRKMFHFSIFTLAGVVGLVGGFQAVQVFGASIGTVVGYAVLQGNKSGLFNALARPTDAPFARFYIVTPFLMTALGGLLSNLFFAEFAILGYITTGWGDAVGEPVGTRFGRHRYRIPTLTGIKAHRSFEGSAAVFTASLLGCVLFLLTGFDIALTRVIVVALVLAVTTMLVEAVSFHGLDNLTIQLATSGVCYLLM